MALLFFCKIRHAKEKKYIYDWRDEYEHQV